MGLNGNDLVITAADGERHGYVLYNGREYGEPLLHVKSSPQVPLNIGSATPAQAGGQYDVRDAEGDKAITHLDWTLGAGQRSLDSLQATPFRFWDSKSVDISKEGELSLLNDVTYTDKLLTKGPVYATQGYFFLGQTAGALQSSPDGVTWTPCEITASPAITGLISCFASDGTAVYFGVPTGANKGIWRGTYNGTVGHEHFEFAKYGTGTPTTEEIHGLAFNGGQLFAAVITTSTSTTRVAQVDITSGEVAAITVTTKSTPKMFSVVDHIALVTAGNSVFWVVSQGEQSFVYKITYDPDTKAMMTEQYMEMPTGFIATCAVGYLSTVYVGGYYKSSSTGVGQGAIYVCADGYSAPLMTLGSVPENTRVPSAVSNDNRIYSMCAAGKDLYFTTNRGAYRWDIDGGGYSHAFDLNSSGAGTTEVVWNAGSDYSWTGADLTNADPPHGRFPTGWTIDSTTGTCTWDHTSNIATLSGGGVVVLESVPTGDDALDNTTGSTFELTTGPSHNGDIIYDVLDGTKWARFIIGSSLNAVCERVQSYTVTGIGKRYYYIIGDPLAHEMYYWKYTATGNYYWDYGSGEDLWPPYEPTSYSTPLPSGEFLCNSGAPRNRLYVGGARAVRCVLQGDTASMTVAGTTLVTSSIFSTTDEWLHLTINSGSSIDGWNLNSADAYPSGSEVEALGYAGIAYNGGRLLSPYTVASNPAAKAVTSSTDAAASVITCTAHGFATNDSVVITGHSTAGVNGTWTITKTGDDTFTIPYDPNTTGTGGYAYKAGYCPDGIALTSIEDVASTGYVEQSSTSFHSGSMLKDFRSVDVAHDPLPAGSSLECSVNIDGTIYVLNAEQANEQMTRFRIDMQGYTISNKLTINRGLSTQDSPVVKSVNVVWDFVKKKQHDYILHCATGANNGRWGEHPEEAISFLFSMADRRATFEDRFAGAYSGAIKDVTFVEASKSLVEGYSGIVKVTVRQE